MSNAILVVGGGFAGLTAAIEAAELGHEVYIVDKMPWLGGRVAQLNKYFPKLCPPSCGLEIQFQRIKNNPKIHCLTLSEVVGLSGKKGDYKVKIRINPRHTAPHNVDFSLLASSLEGEAPSEFELGLCKRKALYKAMPFAYPARWALDPSTLSVSDSARVAGDKFLDVVEKPREIVLDAASIIVATGWQPYDMANLANLGGGSIKNCISNMQMERLASAFGPTGGKIRRPSDGKAPLKVAFVQCAGSRDENHLSYCSYICCMATFKQCLYIAEQAPQTMITVYYIDLRAPGRYIKVLEQVQALPNVKFVKGKVAEALQAPGDKVTLVAENALTGQKSRIEYDLAVLATGMQPSLAAGNLPFPINLDEDGFVEDGSAKGIFTAGCAKMPLDVSRTAQSGTAAALYATQIIKGASNGK